MNHMLSSKPVAVVFSEAISDNAALTTSEIDTLGYDYCSIYVRIGTSDIAMAALKVQESDTSGSGFADIDETDFSDSTQTDVEGTALALPAADSDNTFRVIHIDLRARKRYLDVSLTSGNGTNGSWIFCMAILSKAAEGTITNAKLAGTSGVAVVVP